MALTLSKEKITTDDPGRTTYTVTLTNDLDPVTQTPGNTVISVELNSPNGSDTVDSAPIFLSTTAP